MHRPRVEHGHGMALVRLGALMGAAKIRLAKEHRVFDSGCSAVHCECLVIVGSDENDTQIVNDIVTFPEVLTFVRCSLWSISRRNPCLCELFGKTIFEAASNPKLRSHYCFIVFLFLHFRSFSS